MSTKLTHSYRNALDITKQKYPTFFRDFSLVLAIILFISAFSSIVPLLLRESANLLSNSSAERSLLYIVVSAYALAWTVSNAMEWLKSIATSYVMVRCDASFYRSLFECFLKLTPENHKILTKGEILSDFDRSMTSFGQINQTLFWTLAPLAFELVLVFIILWKSTSLAFSFAFLVSITLLFLIAIWVSQRTEDVHLDCFDAVNELTEFLSEKIDATNEILINASQPRESRKIKSVIHNYTKAIFKANSRMVLLLSLQVIAIGMTLLAFTLTSANLTLNNQFSVGDFVMVVSYVVQLTAPFAVIASSLVGLKRDHLALEAGLKYFKLTAPSPSGTTQCKKSSILFKIDKYQTEHIKPLSTNIQLGKTYAICGPSGSGKTTLINSMIGLNRTYTGSIALFGADLKTLSSDAVIDLISVVQQTPFIFSGTVRENLLYGTDRVVDDSELIEVIDALDLHLSDDVSTNSLDIAVGGENRLLSGGEQQRIGIARAVLRQKRIIILDEPTSALDENTAKKALRFLRSQGGTLIFASHQGSIIKMADEIVRIELMTHAESFNEAESDWAQR